jgi:hypothetical protein
MIDVIPWLLFVTGAIVVCVLFMLSVVLVCLWYTEFKRDWNRMENDQNDIGQDVIKKPNEGLIGEQSVWATGSFFTQTGVKR